jgi:demethylphylloquinone reductase
MTQQSTRICILGGGFGGLYTALRLSQLPWEASQKPEIVLVDQNDRFLFSPLLYELLTRELQTWEIAPPYEELLQNTGIRFYQAVVSGIDIDKRRVQLHDGPEINYDRLVLAMGGETPLDLVLGATSYAYAFRTITDVYRLEERLRILEESDSDKIRVAIVGGGYSGVELACKLADRIGDRGRFRLIELSDQILRNSPEFNREAAKKALEARGVFIDLETKVNAITQDTISLEYKAQVDTIPVDLVLWTVGVRVNPVVRSLPIKQSQRGLITTTATLQVPDHPEIFALGDLADCLDAEGQKVPASAQVAFQQADYTAWNIWASLTNRPLLPFRYQYLGEMMALGVDNATLTGLGVKLDGPLAFLARRVAYLYRMPTLEHKLKVGFNWLARPIVEALSK